MKFFIPLICILILTSCFWQSDIVNPSDREGDILLNHYFFLGRWVLIDRSHIMTAAHVIEPCRKSSSVCGFYSKNIGGEYGFTQIPEKWDSDTLTIEIHPVTMDIPEISVVPVWSSEWVFIYSHSWTPGILSWTILEKNARYYAYGTTLSGQLLRGAMIDIVVPEGESGTPVWNTKWELIGVMSAIDAIGKRGYIAY